MPSDAIAIPMQTSPPTMYHGRTPTAPATGPASRRLRGIIAAAPLSSSDMTRPCIPGSTVDCMIAISGPLASGLIRPVKNMPASAMPNRSLGATDQHHAQAEARHPHQGGQDAALEAAPGAQQKAAGNDPYAHGRLERAELQRAAAEVLGDQQGHERAGRRQKEVERHGNDHQDQQAGPART